MALGRPAAGVGGDAEDELARRHAGLEVRTDGVVDVKVLVANRILLVIKQRRLVIRHYFPSPVEVVSLHIVEIELLRDSGQLNVREILLPRGAEHRQQVMLFVGLAERVELFPKFLHQESRVHGVGGRGKFPVDIEAVEDTRGRDSRFEIAVDEQIDAVRDKGCSNARDYRPI